MTYQKSRLQVQDTEGVNTDFYITYTQSGFGWFVLGFFWFCFVFLGKQCNQAQQTCFQTRDLPESCFRETEKIIVFAKFYAAHNSMTGL